MNSNPPIESDAAWPPDPLYTAVLRKVEERHLDCENEKSAHEKSNLPPPSTHFVLVSEWSEVREGDVSGRVVCAWIHSEQGMRPISGAEYQRLATGPRSGFLAILFHICADGQHVVYAEAAGPLAGHGGRYRIDPATLEWHGAGSLWMS